MGWNASMIVMVDCLGDIRDDQQFGKKTAEAIGLLSLPSEHRGIGNEHGVKIQSGCCGNAAYAIETHHADYDSVIAIGGNTFTILAPTVFPHGKPEDSREVKYLRALADSMGYTLRKKPTRK